LRPVLGSRTVETKGTIVLIECYECKARISDTAAACPQCGAVPLDPVRSLPVEVSNIDMKLGTMIWFLIKVAVAAVPAVIVIYTAWTIIGGILSPLLHL
jgi:ribosomal protein L40E